MPGDDKILAIAKEGHGYDVAKLLGIVVTIGTIIFGAGAANEKLKNIDANQSAAGEQQKHRIRLEDDRYEKLKSAFDALGTKVDALTEQVRQARIPHHGRRRATDEPLAPGP